MKIVIAAGIYPPDIGGPATYAARLAAELKQPVISYSGRLKKYPKGLRHLLYFLSLLWLARNIEVIYAQNVTSAGLPAVIVAKLLRKRFVLKIVGDAAWEQQKNYLKKIQEYVAKRAHKIIAPSYYVKKMVAGWGVPPDKIEVIYNAPEIGPQSAITKDEAKEKIGIFGDIILSVGRLVPWKGFDDLVAIMLDLLKENPSFRLLIVGEGQERQNLELRIKNLGLADKIRLAGSMPHAQIPLYFKAADMFVLNSGYEGLSHVILEAMQQGVPVIVSKEGGNPELVEDGFNGILVEYKNQSQLKEAILRLWRDKVLQDKFMQNSREKLKNFTWENLLEQTLNVLKTA